MSESNLRRYTKLPYLLDNLKSGQMPLLNPARWEDKNDFRYLDIYKRKKGLKSLLALCFADAEETYLHWKAYAGESNGICIEFFRQNLINKVMGKDGFLQGYMSYILLEKLHETPPTIDDLPFIKRYAYSGEREYRIICTSINERMIVEYIPISVDDINQIIVNPWVESSVYKSMKAAILKIDGWEKVKIRRSTVTRNDKWGKLGDMAIEGPRKHFPRVNEA